MQAKRNVEFHFAGIGRLSIRESKVKMKFYKEFLRSMDGSGHLVHALSNVSIVLDCITHARMINVSVSYSESQDLLGLTALFL